MAEPPERAIQQLGELSAKYAEAQRNAQKAMALFKEAREENEELRNNFDTLKQAFQGLQGRFRDAQANHTATQHELARVVQERDQKFQAWRNELEIKSRQFEDMKSQVIPPRELEEIKLRLAEELEAPHRQRCELLEEELEKQREAFFQMRRQLEKQKMANDQLRAEHEQNIAEAAEQHRAVEAELNIRIQGLQAAIEDTTEIEELRALQRELEAYKAREKQLLRELSDVRAEKENMRVAREKAGLEARDKVGEFQQKYLVVEAEMDEMRRRVRHLERELQQEIEGHQRTEQQLLAWEKENAMSRVKIDELEQTVSKSQHAGQAALQQQEALFAKQRSELEDNLRQTVREQHEVKQLVGSTRDQAAEEANKRLRDVKEEFQKKIQKLEGEVRAKEKECKDLQRDYERREDEARSALEDVKLRVSSLSEKLVAAEEEKKILEEKIEKERKSVLSAERERDGRAEAMEAAEKLARTCQEQARVAQGEAQNYKMEKERIEIAMQYLRKDVSDLQQKLDSEGSSLKSLLAKEKAAAVRAVEDARAQAKSIKMELNDMKTKAKKFAGAARKMKEQCKVKLSAVSAKMKAQETFISKMRSQLIEEQDGRESERTSATRKIRDLENRVGELELLLEDSSVGPARGAGSTYVPEAGMPSPRAVVRSFGDEGDSSIPYTTIREAMAERASSGTPLQALPFAAAAAAGASRRTLSALPRASTQPARPEGAGKE